MRFIVYRPLSGPWAGVMICETDETPLVIGEGILRVIEDHSTLALMYPELLARGICEGLMAAHPPVGDNGRIQWHWSHQ